MKYNDRELISLGENNADLEGVMHHMKPIGNDWSDWYQRPSFKERYFKLILNILFYYRVAEEEPIGILILENAQVSYEKPHRGIPFAFSITFKVNDKHRDDEAKHIFSCRCEKDVATWVIALKRASYEYWRSQYIILKTKLSMKIGEDPVLEYIKSKNCIVTHSEVKKTNKKTSKSTFYSNIDIISTCEETRSYSDIKKTSGTSRDIDVDNLITFEG
ncbi:pleckstrin homology domain-containing family J member 1-like [Diorhabda carinulata]|uniref:pleckstrin homology domain-containing family J member 1-like n=1 Tax=Diorhabda carinulata TaxID=1163345 RepID=UPI0025A006BF|nr:pleckstrin homology domain-containing family J member 1-like [Diorhabda carinulata]